MPMVRAPLSVPPPPEFYKELAWVPEAQRKHTGRDASLCPYFFSSLDWVPRPVHTNPSAVF